MMNWRDYLHFLKNITYIDILKIDELPGFMLIMILGKIHWNKLQSITERFERYYSSSSSAVDGYGL